MAKITTVVGDADALIALLNKKDSLHDSAQELNTSLYKAGVTIIFPNTAIIEAITTLARKYSNPALAAYLLNQYKQGNFNIEYVNVKIMILAADIYNPEESKHNTIFDAIVAACAQTCSADAIFSFDEWYKKKGWNLIVDLI